MDDGPDLVQPDHEHGGDEAGHGDDGRAPAGALDQTPQGGGHRDDGHGDEVADQGRRTGRMVSAGQLGRDDAHLDEEQDLEDAERREQGNAHAPVEGGHQQPVPGKRETGDDNRRGNDAVHEAQVTTSRSKK
jgi:hypothetical protein